MSWPLDPLSFGSRHRHLTLSKSIFCSLSSVHGSPERNDLSSYKLRSDLLRTMALSNEVLTAQLQALELTVRGLGEKIKQSHLA